jgi:hypothetical protein
MMELKVTLSRGDLVLRAKDETYLAVRAYLVDQTSNKDARYEMQADERTTHERKLLASIPSSVARFKSALYRYTVADTLSEDTDSFDVTVEVSDRFHSERKDDIERLMGEFIYRNMVSEWWEANYPQSAKPYKDSATDAVGNLLLLLSLAYPVVTHDRSAGYEETRRGYEVLLRLPRQEILDDIHSEILSVSLARRSESGVPDTAMQTDELHAQEALLRSVWHHVNAVSLRLIAYNMEVEETEDETKEGEEPRKAYRITFCMPYSWRPNYAPQMVDAMHRYVVRKCVEEYLAPFDANLAQIYAQRAYDDSEDVKMLLTLRKPGLSRRPLQPF